MKMNKTLKQFKDFAMKGNVVDMAVGVIVGGGFSKVVSSLVNDIIMPLISLLVGRISFTDWKWTIDSAHVGLKPIVINYGMFIQTVLDFVIIAFSIFITLKAVSHMANRFKAHDEQVAAEPQLTKEEILLTEIRDLLKKQQT
ncbi:MAG: large-conductance mechanosensitive channel protein MscL [Cellulosilyticaceae bacterium]